MVAVVIVENSPLKGYKFVTVTMSHIALTFIDYFKFRTILHFLTNNECQYFSINKKDVCRLSGKLFKSLKLKKK